MSAGDSAHAGSADDTDNVSYLSVFLDVMQYCFGEGQGTFCMPEEYLDEIPYMQGSYYPIAYWHGSYQTMDLTQGFNIINAGYHGFNHLEFQSRLTQVKVYDFSAYKGHTQSMARGVGIAVAFFWLAELCIAGAFIFLDLLGGLIIFSINRDRKRLYPG